MHEVVEECSDITRKATNTASPLGMKYYTDFLLPAAEYR